MKYPWAVPGAKVVCVTGGSFNDGLPPKYGFPVEGQHYTINRVFVDVFGRGHIMVSVDELPNVSPALSTDTGWRLSRFRPLRTVEDDVALFAHHLTPAPTDLTVA